MHRTVTTSILRSIPKLEARLGRIVAPFSTSAAAGWNAAWKRVEAASGDNCEDYRALPKVELHRHLEGAVRLKTILDEARRHHIDHLPGVSLKDSKQVFDYFDVRQSGQITSEDFVKACKEMGMMHVQNAQAKNLISAETGGSVDFLKFDEFERLLEHLMLAELRPYVLTDEPFPDLKSLLDRFDRTQEVFKDHQTFRRIAYEAVEDAWNEGIRLLELRYAPSFCSQGHNHSFQMVLKAIQEGVAEAKSKYDIEVGLICIAVGVMGPEEMEKTVDFAIENKDAFVGFDLAGAETELTQWEDHFARVQAAGIPITCHASEDKTTGHPLNAVTAVERLGATRIGHGVQIIQDSRAMEAVKSHGVLLEVSVTSNYYCGCFPEGSHPARELWDFGIPMSINTDDPGIMALDLQGEYKIWHKNLGFSGNEMKETNVHALNHSFLPEAVKTRVKEAYFA